MLIDSPRAMYPVCPAPRRPRCHAGIVCWLLAALGLTLSACAGGSGGEALVEDPTPDADGFITTRSGLKYRVLAEGAGEKPTSRSRVLVHYSTKLSDGTLIDSSYLRGDPEFLNMRELVRGFQEALRLMSVGSHYEVVVPSRLAYGRRGSGDGLVGPDETLTFDIRLYRILER